MIDEAIILAGGLGTRLRSVVNNVPKPMADINGKPFLEYLLNFLLKQKMKKCILAVGYKKEVIKNYFKNNYKSLDIIYAEENEPLGTGGALLQAISYLNNNYFFFINGDTFFNIDFDNLRNLTINKNFDIILSLKYLKNLDRYGIVEIDRNNKVFGFKEKGKYDQGYINAGIYLINRNIFKKFNLPKVFSFEKDFLEKYYNKLKVYGIIFDNYFIDIGIPEDYERAKSELIKEI